MNNIQIHLLCLLLLTHVTSQADQKPNIVLIMCDDMGFSDPGCYGGEIPTPNIDRLAREGIRFTRFKNAGRCCPSRAALMTGRAQHSVDMGWMTAVDEHRPGYRGQLSDSVPTMAEILKKLGYGTYLSGKWHLTVDGNYYKVADPRPNGSWPGDRGFDQNYGGLSGGGSYYTPRGLIRNETLITELPKDYYYTTAITRNAVGFIQQHDSSKPLFLYLAHYAPHRPLEAPEDRVDACRNLYIEGYDVLRQARFDRLKQLGILKTETPLPLHNADFENHRPAWETLPEQQKEKWITEMATYAAMVSIMDDGIGEVVDALKAKGLYENTLLLFLSDNGATAEGGNISKLAAALSNTPYREYKKSNYHGGVSSPFIVHFPARFQQQNGSLNRTLSHITDILPTCLDLAGIPYPASFKGEPITPPDGVSLLPALQGKSQPKRALFFQHESNCAITDETWKLVKHAENAPWELYDLTKDPFEQTDVAKLHPEIALRLEKQWNQWAKANNVLPLYHGAWDERISHFKTQNPDQDGID